MTKSVHIMLVGGGTGGHFFPLMSIADALREIAPNTHIRYIGPDRYDATSLTTRGIEYTWCPAGKRRRYASFNNIIDIGKIFLGFFVALCKLYYYYPDVVISKGGYTSVPVVLAAAFLNIPIVVHESDSVLGSANRLGARFARVLFVAYEHMQTAYPQIPTEYVGVPVLKELLLPMSEQAPHAIGVTNDLPILLVLGGSQGAEYVNTLVLESLDELLPHFNIIHQTGKDHFDITVLTAKQLIIDAELLEHYHPTPFIDAATLNAAYHAAALVISRAGSTSIHEIAIHGKPSIIIPIPESVSHDQRSNAYAYARVSGAVVMEQGNLTDNLLQGEIERIMQNTDLYTSMVEGAHRFARTDAATRIANFVNELASDH